MKTQMIVAMILVGASSGAVSVWNDMPDEWREPRDIQQNPIESGSQPPDDEYRLQEGYRLELVLGELTYPTSVAFATNGTVYVTEAGYSHGPSTAIPRILEVTDPGSWRELARLPDGPLTGLTFHEGQLYTIGGRAPASVWQVDPETGDVDEILTGLPVWGRHFTSGLAFDDDGRLHFGVSDPTNSGVLGTDDFFTYVYLSIFPEARSIPCLDLTIRGTPFQTSNPFDPDPKANTTTSPFHRFAARGDFTERIEATQPPGCNGAIFRLEENRTVSLVASGLRSITGLGFDPEGELLALELGMQASGSRPVKAPCDALWEIEQGSWYGFPDHTCGVPVTSPNVDPVNRSSPSQVLVESPEFNATPVHEFTAGTQPHGFDFAPAGSEFAEQLFVPLYGSYFTYPPKGHKVVRVDLESGQEEDFYVNQSPGIQGTAPDRPYSVAFAPDGSLYLVDFGELMTTTKVIHPSALTGGLWRITTEEE